MAKYTTGTHRGRKAQATAGSSGMKPAKRAKPQTEAGSRAASMARGKRAKKIAAAKRKKKG